MVTMICAADEDKDIIKRYIESRNAVIYQCPGGIDAVWPESKVAFGINSRGERYLLPGQSEYIRIIWSSIVRCDGISVVLRRGQVQLEAFSSYTDDGKQPPWLRDEYKELQRWIRKNTGRIPYGKRNVYVFPHAMKKIEGKQVEIW